MTSGPLRQHEKADDDECRDDRRCKRAAERETTLIDWLVEKIADSGTERTGQNEAAQNSSTRDTFVQK